jgi:hypothetical protein
MEDCQCCTDNLLFSLELYERHSGGSEAKNYSMRLSVSEGAHASSVLDSAVDAVSFVPRSEDKVSN